MCACVRVRVSVSQTVCVCVRMCACRRLQCVRSEWWTYLDMGHGTWHMADVGFVPTMELSTWVPESRPVRYRRGMYSMVRGVFDLWRFPGSLQTLYFHRKKVVYTTF